MDTILRSEQELVFGMEGALLNELHGNVMQLVEAVARQDRGRAREVLAMLAEDVATMQAGLDAHFE